MLYIKYRQGKRINKHSGAPILYYVDLQDKDGAHTITIGDVDYTGRFHSRKKRKDISKAISERMAKIHKLEAEVEILLDFYSLETDAYSPDELLDLYSRLDDLDLRD